MSPFVIVHAVEGLRKPWDKTTHGIADLGRQGLEALAKLRLLLIGWKTGRALRYLPDQLFCSTQPGDPLGISIETSSCWRRAPTGLPRGLMELLDREVSERARDPSNTASATFRGDPLVAGRRQFHYPLGLELQRGELLAKLCLHRSDRIAIQSKGLAATHDDRPLPVEIRKVQDLIFGSHAVRCGYRVGDKTFNQVVDAHRR